jgi:hypothetical protein
MLLYCHVKVINRYKQRCEIEILRSALEEEEAGNECDEDPGSGTAYVRRYPYSRGATMVGRQERLRITEQRTLFPCLCWRDLPATSYDTIPILVVFEPGYSSFQRFSISTPSRSEGRSLLFIDARVMVVKRDLHFIRRLCFSRRYLSSEVRSG